MFLFPALMCLHAFEALYAASLCNANGFTAPRTARWMLWVFVTGVFALTLIPTPEPKAARVTTTTTTQNGEPEKGPTHNGN